MNSTVPAERYCTARPRRTAAAHNACRNDSLMPGAGVSSMIFWLRRWVEQSRSPSAITSPAPSPKIWTSIWRARATYFSRNTPLSLKLLPASRRTLSNALRSCCASAHCCMPMPPPPAVLLSITGKPIRRASRSAPSRSASRPLPGSSGSALAAASARAVCLRPNCAHLCRRRADEGQPLPLAVFGELRVLAQEAIAGVDGLGARGNGGLQDAIGPEIRIRCRCAADRDRLVGIARMRAAAIGL